MTAVDLGHDQDPAIQPSPAPVLIGGCPRSGTTLLGAMLGVGAERLTVPESTFKFRLLADVIAPDGRLDRAGVARRLRHDPLFRLWGIPVPDPGDIPPTYGRLMAELVGAYGSRHGKPDPAVWIDHTPGNAWRAQSLSRLIPGARFVHLVRDGRGVAASLLPLDWGPNTVTDAARWWSTWVAHGLAAERVLGPERVLIVRYEDLVVDPRSTLGTVCDFIGVPFDPAMIGRRDYRVSTYTREMHGLVANGPDRSRVEAWRHELSSYQVSAFERLTGDLLPLLGYEPEYGPRASLGPRHQRFLETVVDVGRRAVWDRLRRSRRRRRLGR